MPTTVVIGTGISAVAYLLSVNQYLNSLNKTLGQVGVVGDANLWQKISHHHAMGQPKQLLTGNLLATGRENIGFAPHQLQERRFMSAGEFSTLLQYYLEQHSCGQIPHSYVSRITKEGSKYLLAIQMDGQLGKTIRCDNVIFAPGPGPARPLATVKEGVFSEEHIKSFGKQIIQGNDFMSPNWETPLNKSPEETTVAVYGGSATAAWVVELAAMRKMNIVCWFTRPGRDDDKDAWDRISKFNDAFPAGERNTKVEAQYRDIRHVLKLISIAKAENSTKLQLTLQGSDGQVRLPPPIDLLVYALGAEHTLTQGVRGVLAPELCSELVAFYDRNLAISSIPSLLAIGSEDRSLMIVGSAMSSAAGFGGSTLQLQGDSSRTISALASYKDIKETLPEASRPAEGIAMVMAGIEALNEYIPTNVIRGGRKASFTAPQFTTSSGILHKGAPNPDAGRISSHDIDFEWEINFNTSNRTQLAVFIAQTTDLSSFAANLAVGLIIHFRTQPDSVRGLSDPQVYAIIAGADKIYKDMKKSNENFDALVLSCDKSWGVDNHIATCVKYYTSSPIWEAIWRAKGVGVTQRKSAL
ncbi:hypothetical protein [Pseudomonas mandelii]|uniref:hypothetical protein n=1 Tax=Pseudomonas mandelii TaxID=75612 RepID=UPI00037E4EB9|nr:hypothetical protein [Pseudomonas mandelii]